MKKISRILWGLYLTFSIFIAFPSLTHADEGNVGYDIQAIIPENQVDKSQSYFDLRMTPGQQQTINVRVNNTSDKDTEFKVSINQAYTNAQGFIDYADSKETEKNNYPIKLSDIAQVESSVTVPKDSSVEVPVNLVMPEQQFDGQVLGAIQVTKDASKEAQGITNSYGYVLGLKLTETNTEIKRDLLLNSIHAAVSFGKTSVVAQLENPTMDAFGHLKYDAVITNASTNEEVRRVNYNNDMQIAPNSYYNFAIDWEGKRLTAGDYKLDLTVSDALGNLWHFNDKFSITKKEAAEINSVTVDAAKQSKIPMWVYIIIGILLAIILVGIIWFLLFKRRKKDENDVEK